MLNIYPVQSYYCHCLILAPESGLKLDQVTRLIQITFCLGQPDHIRIVCYTDSALTAQLEYLNFWCSAN